MIFQFVLVDGNHYTKTIIWGNGEKRTEAKATELEQPKPSKPINFFTAAVVLGSVDLQPFQDHGFWLEEIETE